MLCKTCNNFFFFFFPFQSDISGCWIPSLVLYLFFFSIYQPFCSHHFAIVCIHLTIVNRQQRNTSFEISWILLSQHAQWSSKTLSRLESYFQKSYSSSVLWLSKSPQFSATIRGKAYLYNLSFYKWKHFCHKILSTCVKTLNNSQ